MNSEIKHKNQWLDRAHRAEIKPIFNDRLNPLLRPFKHPLNLKDGRKAFKSTFRVVLGRVKIYAIFGQAAVESHSLTQMLRL